MQNNAYHVQVYNVNSLRHLFSCLSSGLKEELLIIKADDLQLPLQLCLSPLTLRVWTLLRRGVLDATLYDKVCQWLATGGWFSSGIPVSSTNKTDHQRYITEILLKVSLNTITLTLINVVWFTYLPLPCVMHKYLVFPC
jgi:hypothetical protein